MIVVFIRHAESFANAGLPSGGGFADIPITPVGEAQARIVADALNERPSLIVHSSFVRTQQTATPTIARHQAVPVETWPVHEFTNLDPARWDGTHPADRIPHVRNFWQRCDPTYCDGETAESFADFILRARETLSSLERQPNEALIYVFTHGFFLNAVRSLILHPELDDAERMRQFVSWFAAKPILNVQRMRAEWDGSQWTLL